MNNVLNCRRFHKHNVLLRPSLWSSGHSSWLQIQRCGIDFRHYQIFWEVVGPERDSLSLVSTTEELLGRKSSGSGQESREYGRRDPSRWPHDTLYPQKMALTSPTSGGRSVCTVRSRTRATEFFNVLLQSWIIIKLFQLQNCPDVITEARNGYSVQSPFQACH
jgi:hypothetical protein